MMRWSKVIQFRERTLHIPLPRINNSVFCPSNALLGMCLECPTPTCPVPLFRYKEGSKVVPFTQVAFTAKLQATLQAIGFPADKYSGHSFRRGGASYAFQCGLPVDLIKIQGDWSSNACERYLQPSLSLRQQVADTLGKHTSTLLSNSS